MTLIRPDPGSGEYAVEEGTVRPWQDIRKRGGQPDGQSTW